MKQLGFEFVSVRGPPKCFDSSSKNEFALTQCHLETKLSINLLALQNQ